jgi:3-oxoacyl-[acyl-carrier-protein] synthase II
METPRDIVISACGTLSALGIGLVDSAAAWAEGESACFPAARVTPPAGVDGLAGEVPDFALAELLPTPKAYLDRQSELLLAASALARRAGGLDTASFPPERAGLAMGSAWGALETLARFFADYVQKGPRLVKPILFPHSYANAAISLVAMEWEVRGPHLNFVSADVASTQALIAALDLLRAGEADLVMAGGAEALNTVRWRARLAAGNRAPPGEGAAVFLVERAATARARGGAPRASLRGGASGSGAPAALTATCTATIRAALDDADLAPDQIRVCLTTQLAVAHLVAPPWPVRVADELFGDVEGAGGALLTACALFGSAASLPALILTSSADGTVSALVLGPPVPTKGN